MWMEYDGTLPTPAILKPRPLWTGKQILSLVIPECNLSKPASKKGKADWCSNSDASVLIKKGELLCGVMSKDIVGAKSGGLIHIIWRDRGFDSCRDFFSNT